ncbi:DUF4157 domain-containing protein [Streptomyces showdoensis]|uniref:eCIS core domain-containing protein n=1 Tax=Streptomyces showdoensis TaxID=68268 RepID=UPI001F0A3A74|nr:DUF4157 domain-containing protein [Streptomyces showdoensis]
MRDHENAATERAADAVRAPAKQRPTGLSGLQAAAGNAAVVQMLRQAGHAWAQPDQHQHSAGCGHQQNVQRSAVHDVLRTSGRPLDSATRDEMEARLGADFSDVRVHTDAAAKASAAEVGARAYTSGSHVVIGEGGGDKHTLAHELTHVIQQRQGPVAGSDDGSGLKVSDPSDRFEREAEANATRVMSGPVPSEPGHEHAVQKASAPTGGSARAVQRLVGFEVEVSAPSYEYVAPDARLATHPGVDAQAMGAINTLFFGGLPYATQVLDRSGDGWSLTTDHNPLQRHGRNLYLAIARAGLQRNQKIVSDPSGYVSVSNLEYVSHPLDEMAAGSDRMFTHQLDSISQHIGAIFAGQPRVGMQPLPGSQYLTGFPDQALRQWLGDDIYNAVKAEREAFANAIDVSLSIQATAGVLPSGMPDLYATQATRLGAEGAAPGAVDALRARGDAAAAVPHYITTLFDDPAFQQQLGGMDEFQRRQVHGLLSLGLSYVIGNAMNQTQLFGATSTTKNAVPLLVKLEDLAQVHSSALGDAGAVTASPQLIDHIADWFHNAVPQTSTAYWTQTYKVGMGTSDSRGPIHGDASDPRAGTRQLLRALFRGETGFETVRPGRPLARPDQPSPQMGAQARGQGGVPMEFRWGGKAGSIGEFQNKTRQFIEEVRAANLAHLGEAERNALRQAF